MDWQLEVWVLQREEPRHRDLAQIIRRNHNRLSPAWSFEAVTTPVTHLTIARSQNRTLATVTARPFRRMAGSVLQRDQWSKRAAIMWGGNRYRYLTRFNPASPPRGSSPPRRRRPTEGTCRQLCKWIASHRCRSASRRERSAVAEFLRRSAAEVSELL